MTVPSHEQIQRNVNDVQDAWGRVQWLFHVAIPSYRVIFDNYARALNRKRRF